MTLDELQKKITPLPWSNGENPKGSDMEGRNIVADEVAIGCFWNSTTETPVCDLPQAENLAYARHCANHFGQVVEALRDLEFEIKSRFGSYEDMSQKLQVVMLNADKALTTAQEVEGV